MNREQFIRFVKSPEALDSGTTPMLEKLVKEYPYCQTAEVLYALNLNKENNFRFNTQLKTAAAYAPDRRLLKNLLHEQKQLVQKKGIPVSVPVAEALPEEGESGSPAQTKDRKQELIHLIGRLKIEVESILTIDEDPSDRPLIELASKLEEVIRDHEHPEPMFRPDIKDYNFAHLRDMKEASGDSMSQEDLIDKFIKEEPKIDPPRKAEFFDAVDYAKHGLEDKEDIVSETLAKVHLKQGYPEKAIKIYERLSLVYPEKSSFFAAQIEKIRADHRTDH